MPSPNGVASAIKPTIPGLAKAARDGQAFACLTAYDATTARWLARAGVHVLLVGDTASEMVLGFSRTIDIPLDVLLALTAGVQRGSRSAGVEHPPLIMGDMPFMSYQASPDDALRNAGRFLTEGLCDIVKLEVDASFAPLVDRMTRAGIPVCAHIGSRPQRAALTGGYASAGRTSDQADQVVRDAQSMLDAGAVMLLVEAIPEAVTSRVMLAARANDRRVPVIGIGAGPEPDGQVLVINDLLGLTDRAPAFAAPVAQLGQAIRDAGAAWVTRVAERAVGPSPYAPKP
jgi:3-methyl-2-oxobutanoate hydroxymethyltransferase